MPLTFDLANDCTYINGIRYEGSPSDQMYREKDLLKLLIKGPMGFFMGTDKAEEDLWKSRGRKK